MDCGPKGNGGDIAKPMLSKRGLQDVEAASKGVTNNMERKKDRRQAETQN